MALTTTIKVPVEVKLVMDAGNGQMYDVTPDVLSDMGYVQKHVIYDRYREALAYLATGDYHADLTEEVDLDFANDLRYLAEIAIYWEDTPEEVVDHFLDAEGDPGNFRHQIGRYPG